MLNKWCQPSKRQPTRHSLRSTLIALLGSMLVACGGGGGGAESQPTVVTPEISIASQPSNRSTVEGDSARFDIVVIGEATLQWQKSVAGFNQWSDMANTNVATLTVNATSLADSGTSYRVVVRSTRNFAFVLTSSPAVLSVTRRAIPPAITQAPMPQASVEGGLASFSVTATGTALNYQWKKSVSGGPFVDVQDGTNATLTLQNLALSDDGSSYRVIVSNTLQQVESAPVLLSVMRAPAAPLFNAFPLSADVLAGQTASFFVVVAGFPTPTLQWQRSTDAVTWNDIAGATGASYTTGSLTLADGASRYRVAATNTRGTVLSAEALVRVSRAPLAPIITSQPADVTSDIGVFASFSVAVDAFPTAGIQWQVSLDNGVSYTTITGSGFPMFDVAPVTQLDDGKLFRAVVTNDAGTVTSRAARLTVVPSPHMILQPVSVAFHSGDTEPAFSALASGAGVTYQWAIKGAQDRNYQDVPGATSTTYVHRQRLNDTTTSVRVTATNATGHSESFAGLNPIPWRMVNPKPISSPLYGLTWVDASTLVAVGDESQIWRSADSGLTWTIVAEGGYAADSLFAVASNGGSKLVAVGRSGQMRRGIDSGLHWEGVRQVGAYALYGVAFINENTVVSVGANGSNGLIFRSTDSGVNWQPVNNAGDSPPLSGVAFSETGVGLAVGASGKIMRSINDGAQWLPVVSGTSDNLQSVAWVSATTVVAAGSHGAIRRSTDAGVTWQSASGRASNFDIYQIDIARSGQGLATTALGFLRTTDGGASWAPLASVRASADYDVKISADGTHAVSVGESGLVRRSVDSGVTWAVNPRGAIDTLFGVAFADQNRGVAVGSSGRMLRTTNAGDDWAVLPSGTSEQLQAIAFADSSTGVAVGYNGAMLRSTDSGLTWTPIGSSSTVPWKGVAFATPSIGIIAGWGMLRTTDGGLTWSRLINDTHDDLNSVSFADANLGLAVGSSGKIKRSIDGGQNWTTVASGTTNHLQSVCFADATRAYAVGWYGTYLQSADGGLSWTPEEVFRSDQQVVFGLACKGDVAFAAGEFSEIAKHQVQSSGAGAWNPVGLSSSKSIYGISLVGNNGAIAVGSGGSIVKIK